MLIPVVEEIETSHLIWTIVGAEARADAAVVDHYVEAFRVVHCRAHGTDVLAGSLFTVHAQHRLEEALGRLGLSFEISINAQPMHLALVEHLSFADYGNVVFRLTGDDASVAADTAIQIDTHGPSRGSRRYRSIQVRLGRLPCCKVWICSEFR